MPDREKVIIKLQDALENAEEDGKIYAEIRRPVVFDALELLKEQEEEIQSLRRENHDILTQFHEWAKEQQQIVRCKDCKRRDKEIVPDGAWEGYVFCKKDCAGHKEEWFCADGETDDGFHSSITNDE